MSDRRRANVEVYERILAAQNSGNRDAWGNDDLFRVSCRDGKAQRIFEYSNPQVYAAAVGA